jgi:hypothetical protein
MDSARTRFAYVLCALLLGSGCAPSSHSISVVTDTTGDPAGFFLGLWHGFIMLVTFVISLFDGDVAVYEVHNTGKLYDLGFVLGAMCMFGSSGHRAKKKRKRD